MNKYFEKLIKFYQWAMQVKLRYVFISLLLSLYIATEFLSRILFKNLSNGVYNAESDSIGIPIMASFANSVTIFVLSIVGILLLKWKWVRLIGILLLLIALIFSLSTTAYWHQPNHEWIMLGHIPTLFVSIYLFMRGVSEARKRTAIQATS